MKKLLAGVAVALALGTTTASADGVDRKYSPIASPPPPIHVPSWSGFYIGAGVGGGAFLHDTSVSDPIFDEKLFSFGGGGDGVLGTVIVGWDWQLGPKTVFGVFADYDFFDLSSRNSDFNGFFNHSSSHDSAWSVGVRLGVLSSPSTLWYLTGGYTQLELDHSMNHSIDFFGIDNLTVSRDRQLDGWFVGAGVDTRLAASNWFLRLEYRYTDFDTGRLRISDEEGFDLLQVDTDVVAHTARLTLTYKFTPGLGWGR
jgi:outer membrane immunogenic protein